LPLFTTDDLRRQLLADSVDRLTTVAKTQTVAVHVRQIMTNLNLTRLDG
jgi:hypothetical protein